MGSPTTFRDLLAHVTPPWRTLAAILGLMALESLAALASPWLAGRFTTALLGEEATLGLGTLALLWLVLLALQAGLRFGGAYLSGSAGAAMLARLTTRLYDHLQALPLGWHHERRRGAVLALLTNDAWSFSRFVTSTAVALLPMCLTFAGALALMAWLDPLIALLAGAAVPVFFLVIKLLGRRIRPLGRAYVDAWAESTGLAEENLGLLQVIKGFTREPLESRRYAIAAERLRALEVRQLKFQALLSPAVQFLAAAAILGLLLLASRNVVGGTLTPGELVSLLLYGMLLTRPMSGLADSWGQYQHARGAAERLVEAFTTQPEPDDAADAELPPVRGAIRFEGITFAYPDRPPVLQEFNLAVEPGETVAITGPNGCGKSTLAHLLKRFADPASGRITVDGTDLRSVSIASLRRQIGLVPQHVLLLDGSIADNIAYGRPDASREAIEAAAKLAHADTFIRALPEGYATRIGHEGVRLSGGQRQRLALARALLKDPPILVLDEATAMFDPEGERAFLDEIGELLKTKTVLLITHRPASLALADRVVSLASAG